MSGPPNDRILDAIFSGRAALFAGQGLSAVSTAQLLSLCDIPSAGLDRSELQICLIDPVRGETVATHTEALDRRDPPPGLRQICGAPWALVVSTVIDASIAQALLETNREARRLRHHFVDHYHGGTTETP